MSTNLYSSVNVFSITVIPSDDIHSVQIEYPQTKTKKEHVNNMTTSSQVC